MARGSADPALTGERRERGRELQSAERIHSLECRVNYSLFLTFHGLHEVFRALVLTSE